MWRKKPSTMAAIFLIAIAGGQIRMQTGTRTGTDNMSETAFDRYTAPQPQEPDEEMQPYQAFGTGQQTKRNGEAWLRICFADGKIALMSYGYLTEVFCTSHQFVSLVYTNCIITLQGR